MALPEHAYSARASGPDTTGTRTEVDVVVVGAGLSGLVTARELVRNGWSVRVIEARDRVGGRTLNHQLSDGSLVELGGQWVGRGQTAIYELISELGLDTFPSYCTGKGVLHWRGRTSRFGHIPRLGLLTLSDFAQSALRLQWMSRRVCAQQPWAGSHAADYDRQTLWAWLTRHVRTQGARDMWTLVVQALNAVHPAELSLLHFLFFLSAGGRSVYRMTALRGGAQQDRVIGGSQRISERLAEDLGARIVLSAPAREIRRAERGLTVLTDHESIIARRAVVATSPGLARRIFFDPPMPGGRDQLEQRVAHGAVIKAMAVYPQPFWRGRGLSGEAIADDGPVTMCFDNSPAGSEFGVLVGFAVGPHAHRLGRVGRDERRRAFLAFFTRSFGSQAEQPLEYVDLPWADEQWSAGCYAGVFGPGTWTSLGNDLRDPVEVIHWAGSETADRWYGYMDGAVSAGRRAATEVHSALRKTTTAEGIEIHANR